MSDPATAIHQLNLDDLHLGALNALADDTPVVMMNLMRFRERSLDGNGSGWDAYLRYSALAIRQIKARGGTIIWTGVAETLALGAPEGERWDYAALVRYPSRAAFIDMMTSADYARANLERANGCAAHTIIATRETFSRFTKATRES